MIGKRAVLILNYSVNKIQKNMWTEMIKTTFMEASLEHNVQIKLSMG